MLVKINTAAYVLCQYVLITSEKNAVVNHLAVILSEQFPDSDPLRV